jgi:hypothetical protein
VAVTTAAPAALIALSYLLGQRGMITSVLRGARSVTALGDKNIAIHGKLARPIFVIDTAAGRAVYLPGGKIGRIVFRPQ